WTGWQTLRSAARRPPFVIDPAASRRVIPALPMRRALAHETVDAAGGDEGRGVCRTMARWCDGEVGGAGKNLRGDRRWGKKTNACFPSTTPGPARTSLVAAGPYFLG